MPVAPLGSRLAAGAIGASLAITQHRKLARFVPNVVGPANATVRIGNAVDGAIPTVLPLILASLLSLGVQHTLG